MSESVYCASEPAVEAATVAWCLTMLRPPSPQALARALVAAHAPSLGVDRSVCLRDVLDWLEVHGPVPHGFVAAHYLRAEFGGEE